MGYGLPTVPKALRSNPLVPKVRGLLPKSRGSPERLAESSLVIPTLLFDQDKFTSESRLWGGLIVNSSP